MGVRGTTGRDYKTKNDKNYDSSKNFIKNKKIKTTEKILFVSTVNRPLTEEGEPSSPGH